MVVGSYKGYQEGCIRDGESRGRYRRACRSNVIMWLIFVFKIHLLELAGDLLLNMNVKVIRFMIILDVVYFFGW
jgi:hypothetical protein